MPIEIPDFVAYKNPRSFRLSSMVTVSSGPMTQITVLNELLQSLLLKQPVDERNTVRQCVIEDDPAHGGVDDLSVEHFDRPCATHPDRPARP